MFLQPVLLFPKFVPSYICEHRSYFPASHHARPRPSSSGPRFAAVALAYSTPHRQLSALTCRAHDEAQTRRPDASGLPRHGHAAHGRPTAPSAAQHHHLQPCNVAFQLLSCCCCCCCCWVSARICARRARRCQSRRARSTWTGRRCCSKKMCSDLGDGAWTARGTAIAIGRPCERRSRSSETWSGWLRRCSLGVGAMGDEIQSGNDSC